jgi:hypothetical protein
MEFSVNVAFVPNRTMRSCVFVLQTFLSGMSKGEYKRSASKFRNQMISHLPWWPVVSRIQVRLDKFAIRFVLGERVMSKIYPIVHWVIERGRTSVWILSDKFSTTMSASTDCTKPRNWEFVLSSAFGAWGNKE